MPPLGPSGLLPTNDAVIASADPWVKRMLYIGVGLLATAVVAFVVFKLMLGSSADELRSIAQEITRR